MGVRVFLIGWEIYLCKRFNVNLDRLYCTLVLDLPELRSVCLDLHATYDGPSLRDITFSFDRYDLDHPAFRNAVPTWQMRAARIVAGRRNDIVE